MTKVQALEEEIKALSPDELAELREWLLEREDDEWDRQIAHDAASGKLDQLFEKSIADHEAGKSREMLSIDTSVPTAGERYRKLRDEIVASGLPLLGDDELRKEIESRKS